MSELAKHIPEGHSLFISHVHTKASDGMVSPTEVIQAVAKKQQELEVGILVAITDHNTIKGLAEAQRAGQHYGVPVVAGQEINSGQIYRQKHMLAYWEEEPTHPVTALRPTEWTIDQIKQNGGVAIPAHPGSFMGIASLTEQQILSLGNREDLDGLEVINGGFDRRKRLAPILAQMHDEPRAQLAGSDSHFGEKDLFTAINLFAGSTTEDLFNALKQGTTIPLRGLSSLVTKWDRVKQNKRSLIEVPINQFVLKRV